MFKKQKNNRTSSKDTNHCRALWIHEAQNSCRDRMQSKQSGSRFVRLPGSMVVLQAIAQLTTRFCRANSMSFIRRLRDSFALFITAYPLPCVGVPSSGCVFVVAGSSAFSQALGDLSLATGGPGWQVSANLSRAFCQLLLDLEGVRSVASSAETTAPAPRPDFDFLTLSWILGGGKENKGSGSKPISSETDNRKKIPLSFEIDPPLFFPNSLTGSFIPFPCLPSPSPRFQPIFSNIFRPLLTSLISL